jgi:PIN domain nuclease of toxin-antitoxin system
VAAPEDLSKTARAAVETGECSLSIISYWEVMIKSMKGTVEVGDPRHWWRDTLVALSLQVLLLRPEHIARIHQLPAIHQDPFDRALIAQAITEKLELVTTNTTIPLYGRRDSNARLGDSSTPVDLLQRHQRNHPA